MTQHANAELLPLGELGDIASGSTPKTGVKEYWNGDIPWITPADLTNHQGVWFRGKLRRISKLGFEACSTRMLPRGSILFSSRAPIGHCAVAAYPLCTNQGFKSLVPNQRLDSVYGYFALRAVTPSIVSQGRGATFAEVSKEIMESVRIPVRPLPEQKRIAALLEKADRLRRTRRYARQLSDTFLQSVFLEMFGDVEREPNRWDQLGFSEVCKISDDSVDPKASAYADLPQISSEDIEPVSGQLRKLRTARQKGVISVNFLVQPSQIVFSKIRPNLRKVAYPKMRALCSADIYPLQVIHPECELYYVLSYLRGDSFSRVVTRIAESRSNIPKVNRAELSELTIPVPPLPLQEKFATIVRRFERLRVQHREAERQAEHLFQTLLHRAFTTGL